MEQLIIRAAQSAFNQAGYQRDEAYRRAQGVAGYLLANLAECRSAYGVDDEFELADKLARLVVSGAPTAGRAN